MKTRAFWTLGVAVLLAGTTVYLANDWLERQSQPAAAQAGPELTPVIVAATPLEFGSAIRAEHLRVVQWPVTAKPQGVFAKPDELLSETNERVALRAIEVGEPILKSKVSGFGGRAALSSVISAEMRAATIRVNDVNGVAGFVLPGDRVDVMLTRNAGTTNMITDVLLQNLKVLAIDQDADQDKGKPSVAKAVTLEVTPEQAQKLVLAQQVGFLSLALRNVSDTVAAKARTVGVADLRVGEANNAENKPSTERKVKVTKVRRTSDPRTSVRIVRGTDSQVYKVRPETGDPAWTAPQSSLQPRPSDRTTAPAQARAERAVAADAANRPVAGAPSRPSAPTNRRAFGVPGEPIGLVPDER